MVSILAFYLANLMLTSCMHDPVGIDEIKPVRFDSFVFPVLQASCGMAGCHGNGSSEDAPDLYT